MIKARFFQIGILVSAFLWGGDGVTRAVASSPPDWSQGFKVPEGGRPNPYGLDERSFQEAKRRGLEIALGYPVPVTGSLVPFQPFRRALDEQAENPVRKFFLSFFKGLSKIRSTDDFYAWMGLHSFPKEEGKGAYFVPLSIERNIHRERMGVGVMNVNGADGMTFACATCHSADLFGRRVLGMTNRFPRANGLFLHAKRAMSLVDERLFKMTSSATSSEAALYAGMREHLRSVEVKKPLVEGLDTSLSQVALSMSRRSPDAHGSYSKERQKNPDAEILRDVPADSKPAVWWSLKYKNRWLSDGSVVSGNPVFTNILWNEIGRGGDLLKVESWLQSNSDFIRDLTTAVFSAEAPRFSDFFEIDRDHVEQAKRGEKRFEAHCARCHGVYEKAWNVENADRLSYADQVKTLRVKYRSKTPVMNVGTDDHRSRGMASLERRLNGLSFSTTNQILIEAQKGYVPPPLEGVWARWPYFHNNSAPSLCAVLTRGEDRPATYYAGEAKDPARDFDSLCNGYPIEERVPAEWKKNRSRFYDSRRAGLGRMGHDERIFLENGKEKMTDSQKRDLIRFLQTL